MRIDEDITFRKLEVLLVFLQTGNLGKTAEQLGTSTASVHRALHSLEAGVRCRLFRPVGRHLEPTEAAHRLAESAREVLRHMADGVRATREAAGYGADLIRIGSLYSLTNRVVPTVIQGLKLRKPDVQTELVLGSNVDLLRRLRDGSIDAALMGLPDDDAGLQSQEMFQDDIFFAAPAGSRYRGLASVDLATCVDERFVSLTDGFVTSRTFADAFRIAGFVPHVVMTTGDIFSLMNLVGGGMGCTLLPGRVKASLQADVALIPLTDRYAIRQRIGMCFLRNRERDPNVLALLATCRGYRDSSR
jgi:LysR family malonate utilization transcriptional regulator